MGYCLNRPFFEGLSVTSGKRLLPCRCRQRCNDERVKCGMLSCKAYRQSSRGSSVCLRKATIAASSSALKIVECVVLGPMAASCTVLRFFHLATVFGLMPYCPARALKLA